MRFDLAALTGKRRADAAQKQKADWLANIQVDDTPVEDQAKKVVGRKAKPRRGYETDPAARKAREQESAQAQLPVGRRANKQVNTRITEADHARLTALLEAKNMELRGFIEWAIDKLDEEVGGKE